MLNDVLSALSAVATLQNFLIMTAGIWGGVIVGAIPGMTGTMAVTLALPFTFYMAPVPSILLLVTHTWRSGVYRSHLCSALHRDK